MTNHPACYAVLKGQSVKSAIIQIVNTKFSPELNGVMTWISIGEKA